MQILRSESSVERACRRYAEGLGCKLIKIAGVTGFPDRMLLTPAGGHMFLEFKREGEELKPLQKHWQVELRAMKHRAEEVDNMLLFKALLQNLGYPPSTKNEV